MINITRRRWKVWQDAVIRRWTSTRFPKRRSTSGKNTSKASCSPSSARRSWTAPSVPLLRNKEIYLGVLLKEKGEQSLGMVPISSQMERMQVIRRDGRTEFALTEELVLHYASLIFGKDAVQETCLFRVTRNADIDVKEGMMDHDIDYREIMADLLKRRQQAGGQSACRSRLRPRRRSSASSARSWN